ncbi:MAG: phosphoribosylanthranilate isomerase [Rhizobiaceae bacterium]
MKPLVKICGLSTAESLAAAKNGGATHLGFIFFPKSPRHVLPELAAELVQEAGECETVAVTVDADDEYLDRIVSTMKPTMLQLHGNETIERVVELRAKYGLPIIKAFAVRDEGDLTKAKTFEGIADILLLDAKPPKGADLPGGNGVSFDWSLIENFQSSTPVLLSGGIDSENVIEAMVLVGGQQNSICGLDVSSGVESAAGVKDISKIGSFMDQCHKAMEVYWL